MKKIAIVSALGREMKYIKDNINIKKSIEIKGYRFSEGYVNDLHIILGITSVGKVNAALCTEILINNFEPDAIINTGIAGALTNQTDILDIVVSKEISYHDIDQYILKGCFPFITKFNSDIILSEKVKNSKNKWLEKNMVYSGNVVSGDSFISSLKEKEKISNLNNSLCVEMEGAAIAHVCYINKIPFISIRGISDKADNLARESYKNNELPAANAAGKFVVHILESF